MKIAIGDIQCKALYLGNILIWAITEEGDQYLNGEWIDSLVWEDAETWIE